MPVPQLRPVLPWCEAVILAGGRSTRFGKNKFLLTLDSVRVVRRISRVAWAAGLAVNVQVSDAVAPCGPLGGIFSAFECWQTERLLFLACDMPCVTTAFLQALLDRSRTSDAVFTETNQMVGFPAVIHRRLLPAIGKQLVQRAYSIRALAHFTKAILISGRRQELVNVNTPGEWQRYAGTGATVRR